MKKIIILIIMMIILIGCAESKQITLIDMEIKEKKMSGFGYALILEKEGQEIELRLKTDNEYNALKVGSVVNVTYGDDYYINSLTLPKLQSENGERN